MHLTELQQQLEHYFDKLWPICRSLTGQGVRDTLDILSEIIPLERYQVASGTKVYDWTVPDEWNIRDAYIVTPDGRKVAQFSENNLHVLNYSEPVDKEVDYATLARHVRTLPNMPDAIPYVTSYYKRTWGFCMTHREWEQLPKEGTYRVVIDSTLAPGVLDYGECVLKGSTDREVMFSTYVCHPSMANNELSGPLVQAFLYKLIAAMPERKYTYRFVFTPETIGVIAYLSRVGEHLLEHLDAGYVLTCVGDRGALTYKQSKRGDSLADRVAEHILRFRAAINENGQTTAPNHEVINFSVGGSDERQYCSPGFNLPVGSLMRTPYQRYKEYHTSLDNKAFISFRHLADTVLAYHDIVQLLELNEKYVNTVQFGEPQLGKRGLYPDSVNPDDAREEVHRRLHLLSYADGQHDLIEIAELRGCSALDFAQHIADCRAKGLL
jgi:aminopeptidase-like protein